MLLWHVQGQLKIWKLIDLLPDIWTDVLITFAGTSHKEMKHRVSYSICVVPNSVNYGLESSLFHHRNYVSVKSLLSLLLL
jgi:hypothetical protein